MDGQPNILTTGVFERKELERYARGKLWLFIIIYLKKSKILFKFKLKSVKFYTGWFRIQHKVEKISDIKT